MKDSDPWESGTIWLPLLLSGESSQVEAQEKGTYMEPAVSWSLGDRTGSPGKPIQLEFTGKNIEVLFERKNTGESCWKRERAREHILHRHADGPLESSNGNDSCIHVKKIPMAEERSTRGLQRIIAGTFLGLGIVPIPKSRTHGALGRIFRRVLSQ